MSAVRVVIDTNVLVSSFLKPERDVGRILDWIKTRNLTVLLDNRILYEYRDVLFRQKFDFSKAPVDELLAFLDAFGEFIIAQPMDVTISDPDDLPFLEVAVSGKADALITGNKKDFGRAPKNLQILSPSEFIKLAPKLYD